MHVPLPANAGGPWRVSVKLTAGGDAIDERTSIEHAGSGVFLGDPIVYRAAPGPRAPTRPVADFQFSRTERVHVEWPILKALDQRQARLLSRNGQPLAVAANVTERPASDASAPAILAVDVNLAPLGPGDYLIELVAGSGADSERKLVAIRVGQ
jgi:hypothetical protein